jgi:hypothetical protein
VTASPELFGPASQTKRLRQMTKRRSWGVVILLALGSVSVAIDASAYSNGLLPAKTLLMYGAIAAFGLYTFGSIFFDYSVTFRTTVGPADSWAQRLFRAGAGVAMWGVTVWGVVRYYIQ